MAFLGRRQPFKPIINKGLTPSAPASTFAVIPRKVPWYTTKPPLGYQVNPSHPLAQGLKNLWLFNEGGGTKANDIVGGNNGALGSGVTWGTNGLGLDANLGTTGTGAITISSFVSSGSFSISCWFTITNTSSTQYIFTQNKDIALLLFGGNIAVMVNGASVHTIAVTTANALYNLTISYTAGSTTTAIYLNGNLQGTISDAAVYTSGTTTFGDTTSGIKGTVALCSVYSRAISAVEAQQLYQTPFAMMQPRTVWSAFPVSASAPSLSASGGFTEAADVFAATTVEAFLTSGGYTESSDTISAALRETFAASGGYTESSDVISAALRQTFSVSGNYNESSDTISASALEKFITSGGYTESADLISASASIFAGSYSLSGNVLEASDIISGNVHIPVNQVAEWIIRARRRGRR